MRINEIIKKEQFTPALFFDMDGVLVDMSGSFEKSMKIAVPEMQKSLKMGHFDNKDAKKKKAIDKAFSNEEVVDMLMSGLSIGDLRTNQDTKKALYIIMEYSEPFWTNLDPSPEANDLINMGLYLKKYDVVSEVSVLTGTVGFTASPNGKKKWLDQNGFTSKIDRFLYTIGGQKYTIFGKGANPGDILIDDRPHKEFDGKWNNKGYGLHWHDGISVDIAENQIKEYVYGRRKKEQ